VLSTVETVAKPSKNPRQLCVIQGCAVLGLVKEERSQG